MLAKSSWFKIGVPLFTAVALVTVGCSTADSGARQDSAIEDDAGAGLRELRIKFADEGLAAVYESGQSVGVTRNVAGSEESKQLLWASFSPQQQNFLNWQSDQTRVFASDSVIAEGAFIRMDMLAPVAAGDEARVGNSEITVTEAEESGEITILNDSQAFSTVGLAAPVSFNGFSRTAPMNAVPMAFSETAELTPTEEITIQLVDRQLETGTVFRGRGPATTIDMSNKTSASLTYDVATGEFTIDQ